MQLFLFLMMMSTASSILINSRKSTESPQPAHPLDAPLAVITNIFDDLVICNTTHCVINEINPDFGQLIDPI